MTAAKRDGRQGMAMSLGGDASSYPPSALPPITPSGQMEMAKVQLSQDRYRPALAGIKNLLRMLAVS